MKIKWILTGLVALLVAVVVAGFAVLSSMEFEDLRGVIEAEARKATGRELALAGPIDLQVSLSPAITVENVTFANAPWGSRSEMISVKRFELEVALLPLLSGEIQVKRLVLVQPDILVETGPKGQGNWEMAGAAEAAAAEPEADTVLPSFDKVVVRDGRLTYRDGTTGEEIRIRLAELEARAASPSSPLAIKLAGAYNDAPFTVDGVLGSLDQLLGEGGFPVRLSAEAGGAVLEVEGTIAKPMTGEGLDLRVQARGRNLADLAALTGGGLPSLGPYALDAQVQQDGKAYKLTGLTAQIGASDLAGNGTLSLAGKRPALRGTFTAGVLDLDDFRTAGEATPRAAPQTAPQTPPAAAPAQDAGQDGGQRFVFTEDPLPLEGLKALDAKLKLSVGRLRVDERLDLSDLDLALSLKGGRLSVTSFSAGFAGGRLAGNLSLDAGKKTPPLAVNLSARGIDYGRLLADMEITDGVTGTLDASAGLRGAGASPRAIVSGLDGRVEVIGGAGGIKSDLLRASGTGLIDMASAWREGEGDLSVNCVVARLPVEGGVMTGEAILLDTAAATVGATGSLDLRSETLDLRVTPQAKQTSLLSLAVPVLVTGTLADPSVGPDPVGTAVGAAKIAGLFINPLVAGAAIVLESETADQNPCLAALAQTAQAPAGGSARPAQDQSVIEQTTEGVKDTLEGVGEGIAKGLKSLFGD